MGGYNIQRYQTSITIADSQTVGSTTGASLNGILRGVLLDVPNLDGTVTVTLDILDVDSQVLYTKASIAENQKTAIFQDAATNPLAIPLSGAHTIRVTASGTQTGGNDTIIVTLLVDKG